MLKLALKSHAHDRTEEQECPEVTNGCIHTIFLFELLSSKVACYNRPMQSILSNPLWLAIIALAVISIALLVVVIVMYMKIKKFLVGFDSKNVSDSLSFVSGNLSDLQTFRKELEEYLATVEKRLKKSVQSVHTVRFNPFKGNGGGGNQSFATAFLNEHGDGVVVSSLYSREHVSVFSKPVKKHGSDYELSEEEREAVEKAKEGLL
jgi:hypothetical protein